MFFKQTCIHSFVESGNNLYCKKCGKYVRMICDHEWKIHAKQDHIIKTTNVIHSTQFLICKKCGQLKYINLTTGEIRNPDDSINIKYNI